VTGRARLTLSVLGYGAAGGLLIAALRLIEYRFVVVEHSVALYSALIAALFAGVGIWLGLTLTRRHPPAPAADPARPASFTVDERSQGQLGITPRELEVLALIADGLSNREISDRLCVSENTVKTHSSRLFDKLGAKRRTQAVQLAKQARLIP
jgi:DNA-binding CsgD family transcriptional regulator